MQRKRFRSPLVFNAEKFSRKCNIPTTAKLDLTPTLFGYISKAAYVFLLLAINLVLFANSGNLFIFNNGILPPAEVFILLLFLAFFSFGLTGIFYNKPLIQNIICSLFTFWFVISLFNQFYQLSPSEILGRFFRQYLGDYTPTFLFVGSHIFLAFILTALFTWFIFKVKEKILIGYVSFFFIIFLTVFCQDNSSNSYKYDFIELYNYQTKNHASNSDKKFIYIMLPNLSSYKYFSMIEHPKSNHMYKLVTGFYAKNNFEVYPNSYNQYAEHFMNLAQSLNLFSDKDTGEHLLNTMMLYKYWNFFNVNDEYIFLKNNQMFDSFSKAGYKISAYKSRGIDICHKNHVFNVNRCIEKINRPVNMYNSKMPIIDRTQLLFAEWLVSTKVFNMGILYRTLDTFFDTKNIPFVSINYENLYVINSINTFDILAENILADKGKQAYFVFADIPSDMFIYDELCEIKPRNKWVNMDNLPWIKKDNIELKQNSYIDQTKCLFGKLQEFIDKLETNNILDNTVLIINGMSSNHNFESSAYNKVVDSFIYDKIVGLAIKNPANAEFNINNSVCSSKNIIHDLLYSVDSPLCKDGYDSGIRGGLKEELLQRLTKHDKSADDLKKNIVTFNTWYEKWLEFNDIKKQNLDVMQKSKEDDLFDSDIEDELPKFKD